VVSTPLASNHDEMPVGISRQNSANVGIEPDSLDPDINNLENNGHGGGGGSEPEPRSESSNAASATSEGANAASTSSQPAPASTSSNQNVKNGGVSKKPRSRHRQKRHTHSDKRYHSEVNFFDFFHNNEIFPAKVEKILKGSLDLIPSPSPSVKIQIMGGKVCLICKGKPLVGVAIKLLKKKLLTSPSNVLPYYLKETFPTII
jgi:hypothetical protein